jgi:hypothetical protein
MKNQVLTTLLLILVSATANCAESSCLTSVDMSILRKSVTDYSEFYGDLPSRINCSKPVGNQSLVCQRDVLRFMERLDHMATVYAYENATKEELDHSKSRDTKWLNQMLKKCRSEDCICSEYKKNADNSLGEISPYSESQ